ncbi:hypothetical protein MKS85_00255 [Pseudomonas sp. JL2]|uniref:hypothetical protein n=1 Tax=Pseudomonas sp. JL2 TaxID=2919942 RepID=UPI00285A699F|nr:hypothetical protein [Pseudomonas sp. JL2]MDR8383952.1 hypothetical protein [Pseudomonas sp. JL2]
MSGMVKRQKHLPEPKEPGKLLEWLSFQISLTCLGTALLSELAMQGDARTIHQRNFDPLAKSQ